MSLPQRWMAALALLVLYMGVPPAPAGATRLTADPSVAAGEAVWPRRLIVGLERPVGVAAVPWLGPRERLHTVGIVGVSPLTESAVLVDLADGVALVAAANALAVRPGVRYVEPDYLLQLDEEPVGFNGVPDDPAWSAQEELRRIEAPRAWQQTTGQADVIIAMLDTGIYGEHVDLAGRVLPGYDFTRSQPGAADDNGHGTYTASLAAGAGNNRTGLAGVCWRCTLLPLKILDHRGLGPVSAFARAVRYAADQNVRLINVSASVPVASETMRETVTFASDHNLLIVASAGNEGTSRPLYPASFDRVLAVGATDNRDQAAVLSSHGYAIDLVAPGVRVTGAGVGSPTAVTVKDGTSVSAPLVTGTLGLLLSLDPSLSSDSLTNIVVESSVDLGPPGRDDRFGHGRLSAGDASMILAARPEPPASLSTRADELGRRLDLQAAGFQPSEELRGWLRLGDGHYTYLRGVRADATGRASTSLPLSCDVPREVVNATVLGLDSGRVAVGPVQLPAPPAAACFQALADRPTSTDRLYFAETGHSLAGGFRTFWEEHGGLGIFGFPISEEFRELNVADGRTYTVQYFERARFEFHPEHRGTAYEVELGLLGRILTRGREFAAVPGTTAGQGRVYFEETRHSLGGPFLAYWRSHGGLALFGYPISEPLVEGGFTVQYFERNRFEFHPELPEAYRVSLGLLGTDLARTAGYRQ